MISASKTTFSHYNLKILRPKVMKNIKNLRKKFCEFRPCRENGLKVDKVLKKLKLDALKICKKMKTVHKLELLCQN